MRQKKIFPSVYPLKNISFSNDSLRISFFLEVVGYLSSRTKRKKEVIDNTKKLIVLYQQATTPFHFIILALLIAFSAFFSASEIAIFRVQEYQIQDANGNLLKKKYRFLHKLLIHEEMILSTILIGNNIANVATSIYGSYLFTRIIVTAVTF